MTYQRRKMRMGNQECFSAGSPLSYQATPSGPETLTATYDLPVHGSPPLYRPPTYDYQAHCPPEMQYTSSTDSNRSAYVAPRVSSMSSPVFAHDDLPTPPPNLSSPWQYSNVAEHNTADPVAALPTYPEANPSSDRRRCKDRYICVHPNCSSSFSRPADLSRHISSIHKRDENMMDCPVPDCSRKGERGFPRKDHLNNHVQQRHGNNVKRRTSEHEPWSAAPPSPSYSRQF